MVECKLSTQLINRIFDAMSVEELIDDIIEKNNFQFDKNDKRKFIKDSISFAKEAIAGVLEDDFPDELERIMIEEYQDGYDPNWG
jgi:hypothetical protein